MSSSWIMAVAYTQARGWSTFLSEMLEEWRKLDVLLLVERDGSFTAFDHDGNHIELRDQSSVVDLLSTEGGFVSLVDHAAGVDFGLEISSPASHGLYDCRVLQLVIIKSFLKYPFSYNRKLLDLTYAMERSGGGVSHYLSMSSEEYFYAMGADQEIVRVVSDVWH